jgi:hypothetical protein
MESYVAFARLGQLTIGVLAGIISIYFGYRLFMQIPVNIINEGKITFPTIMDVKLKVAPGIFFAVLGALIIYVCVARKLDLSDVSRQGLSEEQFKTIMEHLNSKP